MLGCCLVSGFNRRRVSLGENMPESMCAGEPKSDLISE